MMAIDEDQWTKRVLDAADHALEVYQAMPVRYHRTS